MTELYTMNRIEHVITLNEMICTELEQEYEANSGIIVQIFEEINKITFIRDKRERILSKAAFLLIAVTRLKPFKRQNRATATSETKRYLIDNGFALPLNTKPEEDEFFLLLENARTKDIEDETVLIDVLEYLRKNVIKTVF